MLSLLAAVSLLIWKITCGKSLSLIPPSIQPNSADCWVTTPLLFCFDDVLRDACGYQNGWIFWKVSNPKIILQISLYIEDIFDSKIVPKCTDVDVSPKICNYMNFWKWGGEGGQGLFGTFPKIIRFGNSGFPLTWHKPGPFQFQRVHANFSYIIPFFSRSAFLNQALFSFKGLHSHLDNVLCCIFQSHSGLNREARCALAAVWHPCFWIWFRHRKYVSRHSSQSNHPSHSQLK